MVVDVPYYLWIAGTCILVWGKIRRSAYQGIPASIRSCISPHLARTTDRKH